MLCPLEEDGHHFNPLGALRLESVFRQIDGELVIKSAKSDN